MQLNFHKILGFLYTLSEYSNVAVSQVGFITGKVVEVFALIVLVEKTFGVEIIGFKVALIFFGIMVFTILLGWFWKAMGYYDIDKYVEAGIDPVKKEVLEAARRINEGGII